MTRQLRIDCRHHGDQLLVPAEGGTSACVVCLEDERVRAGLCACGCGEPLAGLRSNARYHSDACRSRSWKARNGYKDPRAAKVRRNASQPRRPTPPRISYRKALDAVEAALNDPATFGYAPGVSPRERARRILDPLLPPAVRKALSS